MWLGKEGWSPPPLARSQHPSPHHMSHSACHILLDPVTGVSCSELGLLAQSGLVWWHGRIGEPHRDRIFGFSQGDFWSKAWWASIGLCGYIMKKQIQTSLKIRLVLLWEREKVPFLPYRLVTPNGRLFGSALPSLRNPTASSSTAGRENGSEQRLSKYETLRGIFWTHDMGLGFLQWVGVLLSPMRKTFDPSLSPRKLTLLLQRGWLDAFDLNLQWASQNN